MDKYEFKTTAHNEKKIIIKEEEVKKNRDDSNDTASKKLARNAVICFALLICLMAVKTFGGDVPKESQSASSSEMIMDEDLGKLKFVGDIEYSDPLKEAEVVSAFSESGINTSLSAKKDSQVTAVLSGVVTEIGDDSLVMENCNGTLTEYSGIKPSVHAGENVDSAQVLGSLTDEKLTLTTVGQTGYIDTMDKDELTTAEMTCEDGTDS